MINSLKEAKCGKSEYLCSDVELNELNVLLLLARLESAYSLIWGAQEILGKGGGETLALL